MKRLVLSLILVIIISVGLCSCGKPKDGVDLWNRIDKAMDSLDSYTTEANATISVDMDGVVINGTTEGETLIVGAQKGDLSVYQFTSTEINAPNVTQTASQIVAYDNGNMYLFNMEGQASRKLYSKMSEEEFWDYYIRDNSDVDLNPENCGKVSFGQMDDDGWTLKISEFTKDKVKEIADHLGFNSATFGVNVEDIRIEIVADKKYRVNEMRFELVSSENKTVLTATISYKDFDSTTPKEFDKSSYLEVEDVRPIANITNDMNKALSRDVGSFELVLSHRRISLQSGSNSQIYKETDKISYAVKDGKYTYDIYADADSNIEMSYADGVQKIIINNRQTQTNKQTDTEARALVASLMNNAGYDPINVISVKVLEDGVYELRCSVNDATDYRNIMESLGDAYKDYLLVFTATFDENGELAKLESNLTITGAWYEYIVNTKLEINK